MHDYDGKDGKEIINTSQSVIIKKVDYNSYNLVSEKIEITKKQFADVITERFNDEEVVFDLDMVQTMRYVYSYN